MNSPRSETTNNPTPSPTTSTSSFSSTSTSPTIPTPSFLTEYQYTLMTAYKFHSDSISDLMNIVVDLEISIRRERDEPSLAYLTEDLEKTQRDLVHERDAKRKKWREIRREEVRLGMVGGSASRVARRQLGEMRGYMMRERRIVCLR